MSGSKSDTLPTQVYDFDLAVCGVRARFMKAYTLNCAALRSAFCRASPSGNCSARWSAHLPALPDRRPSKIRPFPTTVRDHFQLRWDCQNLVRGFKLAAKPPSRVAAHGVADHQGSLGTVTLGARESAEFVARRTGRSAAQDRAGLAVLTARAFYNAKRRSGR